jgi:hypothetical protein
MDCRIGDFVPHFNIAFALPSVVVEHYMKALVSQHMLPSLVVLAIPEERPEPKLDPALFDSHTTRFNFVSFHNDISHCQ